MPKQLRSVNTSRLIILGLLGIFCLFGDPIFAAVELIFFEGEISDDGVELFWETGSEINTVGFFLQRYNVTDDILEDISVEFEGQMVSFIPSSGDTIGDFYEALDPDVEEGIEYTYVLFEQETEASITNLIGDFTVVYTLDEDNNTINIGGSGTPHPTGVSPQVTNTPQPTSTTQPTNTPSSSTNSSTTAVPTITPFPTITPVTNSGVTTAVSPTPSVPIATATNTSSGVTGVTSVGSPTVTPMPTFSAVTVESANALNPVPVASAQEEPEQGYPEPDGENEVDPNAEFQSDQPNPNVENDASQQTSEESYVAPAVEEPNVEEVPAFEDADIQLPSIGSDDSASSDTNYPVVIQNPASETIQATESENSRFLLWGSFIASLLIFVAGIIGALYLFRQRATG